MKVQDRQNVNPGLPEKNWLATRLQRLALSTKARQNNGRSDAISRDFAY